MSAHLSEWILRRLHAGELPGAESQKARAHVSACAQCTGVLKGLESNQARFEAEIPFERFVAGVDRALEKRQATAPRPRLNGFLVAVAATVLLAVAVRPLLSTPPSNRLKGGATAELRIGGEGVAQRAVQPGATGTLAAGERVRLGYEAGTHGYVLALSVDDTGEVSALYPTAGLSLPVETGAGMHWLPDSVDFTGSGQERVVVVLTDAPLEVETTRALARKRWEAAGRNVAAMPALDVDGEEVHWILRKP